MSIDYLFHRIRVLVCRNVFDVFLITEIIGTAKSMVTLHFLQDFFSGLGYTCAHMYQNYILLSFRRSSFWSHSSSEANKHTLRSSNRMNRFVALNTHTSFRSVYVKKKRKMSLMHVTFSPSPSVALWILV